MKKSGRDVFISMLLAHLEDVQGEGSGHHYVSQLHSSTEAMRVALFSDRGLMVYLNGGGWLKEILVGGE